MSGIEELRQRVVEAETRFGLINEQRTKYSERLVGLIDAVEARLRQQQAEVERHALALTAQGEELESHRHEAAENQALRGMLHCLLRAIEAGSRDVLSDTMQAMDAKVSALIAETVAPAPALDQARPVAADTVAAIATAPEAPGTEVPGTEDSATAAAETPAAGLAEQDEANPNGAPDEIVPADPEEDAVQAATAEDEPAAEPEPEPEPGIREFAEPERYEIAPEDGDSAGLEDETVIAAAIDDSGNSAHAPAADLSAEPETAAAPVAAEDSATAPALDDPVQDQAVDPDLGAIADASSLEDIMRRVSKLVEDEGSVGPLAAGDEPTGAGPQDHGSPSSNPGPEVKAASGG